MSETARTVSTAGEALIHVAARHRTAVFFGVVSVHNQPLVDAAAHGARFVPVRHEAAAVNAADGYARVTGGLGVAITSTGSGAGNAAGSLVEALTAGSRVLHVTGQIDAEYLGGGRGVIHETKDQRRMLSAVSKQTYTVASAHEAGSMLAAAAAAAVTAPTAPVSVEIPIDLQYLPTTVPEVPVPPAPAANTELVAAAVDLIERAERPLLWLGGGAVGARAQVRALVDATGAGVLTSNAGRGTIDERDPMVVGNFAAAAGAGDLLAAADLLISVGTHFRSNETRHYHLRLPTPHIQIDVDPAAIGRVHRADVGIAGDAAEVIAAIVGALSDTPQPDWNQQVTTAREAVRSQLRNDIGPYSQLCDAMRSAMDASSPFVRDVTIPASAWGNRLLDVYDPTTNINPRGGGIGQGLAMALGAAVGRPDSPTMLMAGDGGIAVHLGEFGSLAQEQPWLVTVLFNDGGYGVLRNLQDHHIGRRSGVDLVTPDFGALAGAYGIEHRLLTDADTAEAVLAEAVGLRCPVVVEVDCQAFGEMPKPFVPPVRVPNAN